MPDLCDLILNSMVAVGAALLGTVVGHLLSQRATEAASKADREKKQRQAVAILIMRLADTLTLARRLPATSGEITDPESQLELPELVGSQDEFLRTFMDLPPAVVDPYTAVLQHSVALHGLVSAARARAAQILGAPGPPLRVVGRPWTLADSSDGEFFKLYKRIFQERQALLESVELLKGALKAGVVPGAVFG